MDKILVTGGLGFIGSHLVEKLIDLNYSVFVIDNSVSVSDFKLPQSAGLFCYDVSRPQVVNLVAKIKPQVIFHLAADIRVTGSSEDIIANNVIGTLNLLEAGKKAGVRQFIFTSSAAVYGDSTDLPIKETHPLKPISAYGISKLTGELYCRQYCDSFNSSVFRFANVYGPRQNSTAEGGAVAIFTNRLLAGKPLIVFGNGRQTRDFVYVEDVVDALIKSLDKNQSFTLNIGSGQSVSVLDLIDNLAKIMGIKPACQYKSSRQAEIEHSLFSYNLAKRVLSWQPKISLNNGLVKTVAYFKNI